MERDQQFISLAKSKSDKGHPAPHSQKGIESLSIKKLGSRI